MHFNKRSRKKVHRTYPHPVYTMPYKYQLSAAILYVLRKNRELLYFPIVFRTFFHNFLLSFALFPNSKLSRKETISEEV